VETIVLRTLNLILCLGLLGALSLACGSPATNANSTNVAKAANTSNTASAANTAATPAASSQAASGGETFTHKEGGITFEIPNGWKAEPDGDQLTVSPPDDSIGVVFWVTKEDDFEAAANALGEELGKQIKNLKLDGDTKEDTHNGMPHASVSGSGQMEGQNIVFSADLLQAKKPVIVLTFATPENFKKHEADYMKLVKSIKKAE
jgi:predicted Zn-dependent protease